MEQTDNQSKQTGFENNQTGFEGKQTRFESVRIAGNRVLPADKGLPTLAYEHNLKKLLGKTRIEAWSRTTQGLIPAQQGGYTHAFIDTLHVAYQNHYSVSLSPDHLWLLIAQGFATHVNQNAPTLRQRLVTHSGKVALRVERDEFVPGFAGNDWEEVLTAFSQQIRQHIGDTTHDMIVPRFSTTGIVEQAAFEITLLDALQAYFTYTLQFTCGIPTYYLEGTPDDWKQLRAKAAALAQFDLAWWTKHLLPVLDQFVAASEGNPDPDFWQSFYRWSGRSGGTYITGHVLNFFPYFGVGNGVQAHRRVPFWKRLKAALTSPPRLRNPAYALLDQLETAPPEERRALVMQIANGVRVPAATTVCYRNPYLGAPLPEEPLFSHDGMTSADLLTGFFRVPFTWEFPTHAVPMAFVAGFVGATQDPETLTLRPEIGWAVCEM